MKVAQDLTELIGNTPLLKPGRFLEKHETEAEVYFKLEYFNPAGSVKDRECAAAPSSSFGCENSSGCRTNGDKGAGCGGKGVHSEKISYVCDCRCVICSKIGFSAQKELERRGILSFDVETSVAEALEKIVNYIYKTDNHISLINIKNTQTAIDKTLKY